ncbi:glycosyl hydrolase family 3 N terminal domain protein [Enterococcus canis]|uniref:beta-glucosidase n=2 Tax=Enterococcus canis TaxID=214095 RepID=A0A1L8RF53_9ENTE|nr:glycoside hydrolase family 3 N-terminal domain-containing protein [Enterococcus canis]OJG18367.1 glycosyl hydrolase family 3 N terminal domain protein [Enterococcus canis]
MTYKVTTHEQFYVVENEGGATLTYGRNSGVALLEVDGFAFKDLNKNGKLDPYEDWRLPQAERIKDLVSQLSIEDIGGLMLYSKHLAVSSKQDAFSKQFGGTYEGKPLAESEAQVWQLTDQQQAIIKEDRIRHLLLTVVDDAVTAAKWNNEVQAFCEGNGLGIPANISSDPRHGVSGESEFDAGAGADISKWPDSVGIAATFDPELAAEYGQIVAEEYRALGIATALSPQIDLATDPRWMRFSGCFSEHTALATDMAKAFCDGLQTTTAVGWGQQSVNAMVKHWPGGGTGEAGRDAHYAYGKFAVYPENQFQEHLKPFTEGAFALTGGTEKAAAVMPYYTISYEQTAENVGNGFNKTIITDLLRERYDYDGVVCTDWGITGDVERMDSFIGGKCWGVEELSVDDRHYKALLAGVDQFGGNNDLAPVLAAYEKGRQELGEAAIRARFEASATRLLRNVFQCGLFENPYTDPKVTQATVAKKEFVEKGYQAQQKSVVLLKNNGVLPLAKGTKVYVPNRRIDATQNWFGQTIPAHEVKPLSKTLVNQFFTFCDDPADAEVALICIESPHTEGYDHAGYKPISLQYTSYRAELARASSIGQDPHDEIVDRTYRHQENQPSNHADLTIIEETAVAMPGKPIIVAVMTKNPFVPEFEQLADAVLLHFKVQNQVLLDLISGKVEPSGLLPFQMPQDMATVEQQAEDRGLDMTCYQDQAGNRYDFGYGLNFNGPIEDARTMNYQK